MSKKMKKALALGCAMAIGTGAFSTSAANLTKNVKAVYNNIKVTYDGSFQTPQYEPFMIDGTVYVSLRDAGQMTNNNVGWDSSNKTVQISSKTPSTSVTDQELANKNLEIATLKNQLAAAEKKVAYYEKQEEDKKEEEAKKPDLSASGIKKMVATIENDYDDKYNVDWDFKLTYDSKKEILDLTVSYSSKVDKTDFNRISSTKLNTMLEDICEDIQKNLGSVEIRGTLQDDYQDETLGSFTHSTKGKFNYNTEISNASLKHMEEDILDLVELPAINSGLMTDVKVKIIDAEVELVDGVVIFNIFTDLPVAKKDSWNDFASNATRLEKRVLENFITNIIEDFKKEYGGSEYSGIISTATERMIVKYEDSELTLYSYR
ncbi:stalk domain-containing protein [Niameybacter massiliensis]|uniref:stalk domain-containing protein n=1 Tax=Niameybacter massiliensis TaxID=1658108 RepID=UPI0006B58E76|nr:hypothetical protein [Niameybacter massiliensis]